MVPEFTHLDKYIKCNTTLFVYKHKHNGRWIIWWSSFSPDPKAYMNFVNFCPYPYPVYVTRYGLLLLLLFLLSIYLRIGFCLYCVKYMYHLFICVYTNWNGIAIIVILFRMHTNMYISYSSHRCINISFVRVLYMPFDFDV